MRAPTAKRQMATPSLFDLLAEAEKEEAVPV
jgi:hypothetical protein